VLRPFHSLLQHQVVRSWLDVVVELRWDFQVKEWNFRRVWFDTSANSKEQAFRLLQLAKHASESEEGPAELRDLCHQLASISIHHEPSVALCSCAAVVSVTSLEQRPTLRTDWLRLHHAIRQWLYSGCCGMAVLELTVGRCADVKRWQAAKNRRVIAYDSDATATQMAIGRAQDSNVRINLCVGDVSSADLVSAPGFFRPSSGFDTMCCHFAIHYMWQPRDRFITFMNNVHTLLAPGARFYVTIMDGKRASTRGSFDFRNTDTNSGSSFCLSFPHDDVGMVDVLVSSIGHEHRESLIDSAELVREVELMGLQLVGVTRFTELGRMLHYPLAAEHVRVSRLFVCAMFEKPYPQGVTFRLPSHLMLTIALFLPLPDALLLAGVSRDWYSTVWRGVGKFEWGSVRNSHIENFRHQMNVIS
jgi:hypothetical protein